MKRRTKILIGVVIAIVLAVGLFYGGSFAIEKLIELHTS